MYTVVHYVSKSKHIKQHDIFCWPAMAVFPDCFLYARHCSKHFGLTHSSWRPYAVGSIIPDGETEAWSLRPTDRKWQSQDSNLGSLVQNKKSKGAKIHAKSQWLLILEKRNIRVGEWSQRETLAISEILFQGRIQILIKQCSFFPHKKKWRYKQNLGQKSVHRGWLWLVGIRGPFLKFLGSLLLQKPKLSPDIVKCPPGGQNCPGWELPYLNRKTLYIF